MYKRVLKLVQGVLHVYKKALKLVQGVFARVQKSLERCKNGESEQFGHEVTSSRFCIVCMTMTNFTSQIICLFTILLHRSDHFPNTLYKVVMLFLIQFTNTTGA